MSLTSTDLATAMGAHVLGYTQPQKPIYRITYEYLEAVDGYDENIGDNNLITKISTHQTIVESVPDNHPLLQQNSTYLHGYFLMHEFNNSTNELDPYRFHGLLQDYSIIPQTILTDIYNHAEPQGLGGSHKHTFLPFLRYNDWASARVLTIYKIERLA